jgi:hypothetical protein
MRAVAFHKGIAHVFAALRAVLRLVPGLPAAEAHIAAVALRATLLRAVEGQVAGLAALEARATVRVLVTLVGQVSILFALKTKVFAEFYWTVEGLVPWVAALVADFASGGHIAVSGFLGVGFLGFLFFGALKRLVARFSADTTVVGAQRLLRLGSWGVRRVRIRNSIRGGRDGCSGFFGRVLATLERLVSHLIMRTTKKGDNVLDTAFEVEKLNNRIRIYTCIDNHQLQQ